MSTEESIQDRLAELLSGKDASSSSAKISTATVASVDGLETKSILAGDANVRTPVRLCYGVGAVPGDRLIVVCIGRKWYGVGNMTRESNTSGATTFTGWQNGASGSCSAWKRNGVVTVRVDALLGSDVGSWSEGDIIPTDLNDWLLEYGGLPSTGLICYLQDGWALSMGYTPKGSTTKKCSLWNTQGSRTAGSYVLGNATWACLS